MAKATETATRKAAGDYKTADGALKAKVPAGKVAEQFDMSPREVQILRFKLGLIKKDSPMGRHWKRVVEREATKK